MNLLNENADLKTAIELRDYYYNQLVSTERYTDSWCKNVLLYELISSDIDIARKRKNKFT